MWEGPLGTVAVVGIATKEASLQVAQNSTAITATPITIVLFNSIQADTWIYSFTWV
jgi:hypothetical protein